MRHAWLLTLEGAQIECLVPDQSVFPRFVSLPGRVFVFERLDLGDKETQIYREVFAPPAQEKKL